MIGVAGAGMQALAAVLARQGWRLTGSDRTPDSATSLARLGVKLSAGHDARNIDPDLRLVIHSDAVGPENVERRHAARLGLAEMSYPQAVAALMTQKRGLAVAGTHGKSTTTAMIGQTLTGAGFDPTVICGATPIAPERAAHEISVSRGAGPSGGEWFIAEACEYRANFLRFTPEIAVVLGIEPDHFDYYRSFDELKSAFAQFIEGAFVRGGLVIANADCPTTRRQINVARQSPSWRNAQCETFGFSSDAVWRPARVRHIRGRYRFEIRRASKSICEVSLRAPGRHLVTDALAAAAACHAAGATPEQIGHGLSQFAGLQRRLEHLDAAGPAIRLDDYAHHPTEIRATLSAVRMMYPGKRISCIFQPHQVSRTLALLDEFAASLQNADSVAVSEVFAARETVDDARREDVARQLAHRVGSLGVATHASCRLEEIFAHMVTAARPGDVIVTLGAGDIRKRCDELAD
jgi:UDP-N-acetylmuramate--alanine ligase